MSEQGAQGRREKDGSHAIDRHTLKAAGGELSVTGPPQLALSQLLKKTKHVSSHRISENKSQLAHFICCGSCSAADAITALQVL